MTQSSLEAGAAERVITPPLGLSMAGWSNRAAGHNTAQRVHDDLFVKCVVVRNGDRAWAVVSADSAGVDAAATERIRQGIADETEIEPHAVLVCATHCHSAPPLCPNAVTVSEEERSRGSVQGDGSIPDKFGKGCGFEPSAACGDEIDFAYRESFIASSIEAGLSAWRGLRPAEVAFGGAMVEGVASSRRVFLKNGQWGDPRSGIPSEDEVLYRTEIDPMARVMLLREAGSHEPLAALMNYGTHPWVFSGDATSAELAGAACRKVAAAWNASGDGSPVVLYVAGPQGDATLIWNVDIDQVWKARAGETAEEELERRTRGFSTELDRLSDRLVGSVMEAIGGTSAWDAAPSIDANRREVLLPLREGYETPPEILLADWQKDAPSLYHRTEAQLLRIGRVGILALPGEPFTALGRAIRERVSSDSLLIAAVANDYGQVGYIVDESSYDLGGYEVDFFPLARGAAEALVEEAARLAIHEWQEPRT